MRNRPPFITETEKSQARFENARPTAKYGRWALLLCLGPVLIPLIILLFIELFRIGSLGLALHCVFFLVAVGLPCCLASFVLGIIGLIREERPIKPAIISVSFSIGPVIFGLWVLWNYLTMGEPW